MILESFRLCLRLVLKTFQSKIQSTVFVQLENLLSNELCILAILKINACCLTLLSYISLCCLGLCLYLAYLKTSTEKASVKQKAFIFRIAGMHSSLERSEICIHNRLDFVCSLYFFVNKSKERW